MISNADPYRSPQADKSDANESRLDKLAATLIVMVSFGGLVHLYIELALFWIIERL